MGESIHIVGAGMGGLACALALARAGARVRVSERAMGPGEVGAGIQLGPNATSVLSDLGVIDAIKKVAVSPMNTETKSIISMKLLAKLPLSALGGVNDRYGSPYWCVHRAELHQVLFNAVQHAGVQVDWGQFWSPDASVDSSPAGEALVAADGLWSAVRSSCGDASLPLSTSHWAWRAMFDFESVPHELQAVQVTAWMGPSQHMVTYPVLLRGQLMLNVVAFTPKELSGHGADVGRSWANATDARALLQALGPIHPTLAGLLASATAVTRWNVAARAPLERASDMLTQHHGRFVALVGDAAHPMRPYMAQGAAMALEDAAVLARCVSQRPSDTRAAFEQYAQIRWARNARVQRKAALNGLIFHLPAPMSWARNAALRIRPQLMDVPWLFGHRAR